MFVCQRSLVGRHSFFPWWKKPVIVSLPTRRPLPAARSASVLPVMSNHTRESSISEMQLVGTSADATGASPEATPTRRTSAFARVEHEGAALDDAPVPAAFQTPENEIPLRSRMQASRLGSRLRARSLQNLPKLMF
jgi:hypothetical protein